VNIQGKTKDGVKVRDDMISMGIRSGLAPQEGGKRIFLASDEFYFIKARKNQFLGVPEVHKGSIWLFIEYLQKCSD